MKKMTREWVRKAEGDIGLTSDTAKSGKRYQDQVCFFGQQSAEKYLKAMLEEMAAPIPKTHNLIGLYALLHPHHPALRPVRAASYTFRILPLMFGTRAAGRQSGKRWPPCAGPNEFAWSAVRCLASSLRRPRSDGRLDDPICFLVGFSVAAKSAIIPRTARFDTNPKCKRGIGRCWLDYGR